MDTHSYKPGGREGKTHNFNNKKVTNSSHANKNILYEKSQGPEGKKIYHRNDSCVWIKWNPACVNRIKGVTCFSYLSMLGWDSLFMSWTSLSMLALLLARMFIFRAITWPDMRCCTWMTWPKNKQKNKKKCKFFILIYWNNSGYKGKRWQNCKCNIVRLGIGKLGKICNLALENAC